CGHFIILATNDETVMQRLQCYVCLGACKRLIGNVINSIRCKHSHTSLQLNFHLFWLKLVGQRRFVALQMTYNREYCVPFLKALLDDEPTEQQAIDERRLIAVVNDFVIAWQ
ncbi:unnamed protein product, partial [Ceratitis capitata]